MVQSPHTTDHRTTKVTYKGPLRRKYGEDL